MGFFASLYAFAIFMVTVVSPLAVLYLIVATLINVGRRRR